MNISRVPPVRFLELEMEKKRREKDAASARPLANSVKTVLQRVAPTKGRDPLGKIQQVRDMWHQAVGAEIAQRSTPERWREGVLTVVVDTAPLTSELQCFGEQALVADLAKMGLEGIHSIRFETGRPGGATRGEGCES